MSPPLFLGFSTLSVLSTFANFAMCTVVTTYLEHPCGATVFSGRAHVGVMNYRCLLHNSILIPFADRLRPKHLRGQSTTHRTASWTALHNGVPAVVSIGLFLQLYAQSS